MYNLFSLDEDFCRDIETEICLFIERNLNKASCERHVLLFPPLTSRGRYFIHNIAQHLNVVTSISIGIDPNRRVAVFFRKPLSYDSFRMSVQRPTKPDRQLYVPKHRRSKENGRQQSGKQTLNGLKNKNLKERCTLQENKSGYEINGSNADSNKPGYEINGSNADSYKPGYEINGSNADSYKPGYEINGSNADSYKPGYEINGSNADSYKPGYEINGGNADSYKPGYEINGSNADNYKPGYEINGSNADRYKPGYEINGSNADSCKPGYEINGSNADSYKPGYEINGSNTDSNKPGYEINGCENDSNKSGCEINSSNSDSNIPGYEIKVTTSENQVQSDSNSFVTANHLFLNYCDILSHDIMLQVSKHLTFSYTKEKPMKKLSGTVLRYSDQLSERILNKAYKKLKIVHKHSKPKLEISHQLEGLANNFVNSAIENAMEILKSVNLYEMKLASKTYRETPSVSLFHCSESKETLRSTLNNSSLEYDSALFSSKPKVSSELNCVTAITDSNNDTEINTEMSFASASIEKNSHTGINTGTNRVITDGESTFVESNKDDSDPERNTVVINTYIHAAVNEIVTNGPGTPADAIDENAQVASGNNENEFPFSESSSSELTCLSTDKNSKTIGIRGNARIENVSASDKVKISQECKDANSPKTRAKKQTSKRPQQQIYEVKKPKSNKSKIKKSKGSENSKSVKQTETSQNATLSLERSQADVKENLETSSINSQAQHLMNHDETSVVNIQTDDTTNNAEDGNVIDDWEKYDDQLDDTQLSELISKTKIEKPVIEYPQVIDYLDFMPKPLELDDGEYGHILEIFDFSPVLKTQDIFNALKGAGIENYNLTWVDDTHALAVFSSRKAAHSAMKQYVPVLQMRQVVNGSRQARLKARDFKDSLLPFKKRPATSIVVARNLVTSSLGLKAKVTPEQKRKERDQLREAKERKREKAKQKKDIWENPDG